MLNKDIYHEILLCASACDLVNMYLAFHPICDIDYYINKHIRKHVHDGDTYYYIPTNNWQNPLCKIAPSICGILHNINDRPAIECGNGDMAWYKYGWLHRDDDKPALIYTSAVRHKFKIGRISKNNVYSVGAHEWYYRGLLHRDNDKPAIIHKNGSREYYRYGELHRDDDKPAIICTGNKLAWYKFGKLHRDNDKPALVRACSEEWYYHGLLHRDDDKPAIIDMFGRREWYRFGISYYPPRSKATFWFDFCMGQ